MSGLEAPPLAVDVRPAGLLLRWEDGETRLPADTLRAACRCGACRGTVSGGRAAPPPTRGLALVGAHAAGAYGLQLVFSDGHDRGIYPWSLMRVLGQG